MNTAPLLVTFDYAFWNVGGTDPVLVSQRRSAGTLVVVYFV